MRNKSYLMLRDSLAWKGRNFGHSLYGIRNKSKYVVINDMHCPKFWLSWERQAAVLVSVTGVLLDRVTATVVVRIVTSEKRLWSVITNLLLGINSQKIWNAITLLIRFSWSSLVKTGCDFHCQCVITGLCSLEN